MDNFTPSGENFILISAFYWFKMRMIGLYVFRHNAVCRLWMFRHVVCEYVGFN